MFHPAFRGHTPNNGMEVEQITSLVSIFSFGQQLFNNADTSNQSSSPNKKTKEDEDSDSDSDTSSDSGHSSDDHDNSSEDKSSDTADDKSDEEISANESQNEENDEDILVSQIERKRTISTPSPVPDSFSCGSDNTKTVHADPCIQQVASV